MATSTANAFDTPSSKDTSLIRTELLCTRVSLLEWTTVSDNLDIVAWVVSQIFLRYGLDRHGCYCQLFMLHNMTVV